MLMDFIWFCAAGYSFPVGCTFFVISAITSLFVKNSFIAHLACISIILGGVLIGLTAMSLSLLMYVVWGLSAITWLILTQFQRYRSSKSYPWIASLFLLLTLIAVFRFIKLISYPPLPSNYQMLYVIGDSISAGIGGKTEKPWPLRLSETTGIDVINLAEAGATVHSARIKQVPQVSTPKQLILLEIGGNDLFGPTPIKEFKQDLSKIISTLLKDDHTVVMFEIPILPWQYRYTQIQRELAEKYAIILIPKRFLAGIFSHKEATSDLAHLTETGHKLMADKVRDLLQMQLK
jgi:lysophospholipase L1-like esterase